MAEYEIFVDVGLKAGDRSFATSPVMAGRQFSVLLVEDLEKKANQEIEVELRDPTTAENFRAQVILSPNPDDLPGSDKLWLVSTQGKVRDSPWAVRILARIEEEEGEVKLLPRRRPSLGERRGKILEEMLKEREKKLKERKDDK